MGEWGRMDIHLPKVPHSWRELAREIGIIVIGVLIALFFEQLVQDWQWRYKIRAAENGMRSELLQDDGPEIYQRAAMHPCIVARLDLIRSAVEGNAARQDIARLIDGYWVEYRSFDHLALDAATTSDVLGRMPPHEAGNFVNIYSVMPLLDRTSSQEAADLSKLRAFRQTGGVLSDDEKDRVLMAVEALRTDDEIISSKSIERVPRVLSLGTLNPERTRNLLEHARQHYGPCVKEISRLPPISHQGG